MKQKNIIWRFILQNGDIQFNISQKDIRQIQMAKSSICSGCLALLEEAGLTLESIDYLVLAGAFGNYIDIDNALSIGLCHRYPGRRLFQ